MVDERKISNRLLLTDIFKSQYKKTFTKFSEKSWRCYLYDRKQEREYTGDGRTRKEAEDDAWDSGCGTSPIVLKFKGL